MPRAHKIGAAISGPRIEGAHEGGHTTARFLEGFLEGSLPAGAS